MDNKKLFSWRPKSLDDIRGFKFRKLYSFIMDKKTILSGFRGSIAHGLTIKPEEDEIFGIDDKDTFSLYCYSLEYYLSLESYYHRGEVSERKQDADDEINYEIRKTFHLLSNCNPNVMTYLYNQKEDYFEVSEAGKYLIDHRDLFLAKRRIRDSYSGYAHDQLTKLSHGAYKGYMGEKRRKVVEKFGYDTKNAMTLFRVLRNGRELLLNGQMQVFRTEDREFLLDIKKGRYQLSEIQKMSDEEFKLTEEAYKTSKLPEENNSFRINELLVDVINITNESKL